MLGQVVSLEINLWRVRQQQHDTSEKTEGPFLDKVTV